MYLITMLQHHEYVNFLYLYTFTYRKGNLVGHLGPFSDAEVERIREISFRIGQSTKNN